MAAGQGQPGASNRLCKAQATVPSLDLAVSWGSLPSPAPHVGHGEYCCLPTCPSKEGKRSVLCKCKKSLMPPQLKAACEQARWFSCKHNHPRDRGSAQRHGWTAVHRTRELHCCAHPALAPLARAGRGLWPTREDALTSSPTPRPSSAPAPRPPEPSAPSGASPPPSGWLWP